MGKQRTHLHHREATFVLGIGVGIFVLYGDVTVIVGGGGLGVVYHLSLAQ